MFLALIAARASAGDWTVESDEFTDPSALSAVDGTPGAHVVRRLSDGAGWVYVAQVSGLGDPVRARAVAQDIVDRTGLRMAVVYLDGGTRATLDRLEPASLARTPLFAAHGDLEGLRDLVRRGPVHFEYVRTVDVGLVARHTWEANGRDLYCRVEVLKGKGKGSVARVVGDAAEIAVDGGPARREDPAHVRAILEAMGPAAVIPVLLRIGDEATDQALAPLVPGPPTSSGSRVWQYPGPASPVRLEIGPDALLRTVDLQRGAVVHELGDYRDLLGHRVPYRVKTRLTDGPGDTVEVQALVVGAEVDPAHFRLATR